MDFWYIYKEVVVNNGVVVFVFIQLSACNVWQSSVFCFYCCFWKTTLENMFQAFHSEVFLPPNALLYASLSSVFELDQCWREPFLWIWKYGTTLWWKILTCKYIFIKCLMWLVGLWHDFLHPGSNCVLSCSLQMLICSFFPPLCLIIITHWHYKCKPCSCSWKSFLSDCMTKFTKQSPITGIGFKQWM